MAEVIAGARNERLIGVSAEEFLESLIAGPRKGNLWFSSLSGLPDTVAVFQYSPARRRFVLQDIPDPALKLVASSASVASVDFRFQVPEAFDVIKEIYSSQLRLNGYSLRGGELFFEDGGELELRDGKIHYASIPDESFHADFFHEEDDVPF